MRARIALSLSLTLVMLVSTLVMNVSFASPTTTLFVNPSYVAGQPGDIFQIDIDVSDVEDLYTFAFELHFAPFGDILAVRTVTGSDFLGVDIITRVLVLEGIVQVGGSLIGQVPGVSGSGTLATIEFKVLEAGESALTLEKTELYDSSPESLIPHTVINGYYEGPHAEVAEPAVLTGVLGNSPVGKVGSTITLASSVTNTFGDLPLDVKVRYDLMRRDGKVLTLWSPQPRVIELYVDGYDGSWGGMGWSEIGTGPLLDAVGDGNYIEAGDYCSLIGMFSLEDFTLLPGEVVTDVKVEAWSKAQSGEIDGDIYIFNYETAWFWAGSIEASSDWGWYFTDAGAMGALYDEASINSAEFLLHYWTPDGSSGPTMTVDAIRVTVTTAITVTADAGATIDMPLVEYTLTEEDAGIYRSLKATCYYTSEGRYIEGKIEQPIMVAGKKKARDFLIVVIP